MEHQDLLLFVLGNGDYSELVCMLLSPYPPSPHLLLEPAGDGFNTRFIPSRLPTLPPLPSPRTTFLGTRMSIPLLHVSQRLRPVTQKLQYLNEFDL